MKTIIEGLPEKPDCVAVAGDSPNDLSMFPYAECTFAPETSFEEVIKAAITSSRLQARAALRRRCGC